MVHLRTHLRLYAAILRERKALEVLAAARARNAADKEAATAAAAELEAMKISSASARTGRRVAAEEALAQAARSAAAAAQEEAAALARAEEAQEAVSRARALAEAERRKAELARAEAESAESASPRGEEAGTEVMEESYRSAVSAAEASGAASSAAEAAAVLATENVRVAGHKAAIFEGKGEGRERGRGEGTGGVPLLEQRLRSGRSRSPPPPVVGAVEGGLASSPSLSPAAGSPAAGSPAGGSPAGELPTLAPLTLPEIQSHPSGGDSLETPYSGNYGGHSGNSQGEEAHPPLTGGASSGEGEKSSSGISGNSENHLPSTSQALRSWGESPEVVDLQVKRLLSFFNTYVPEKASVMEAQRTWEEEGPCESVRVLTHTHTHTYI